MGTDSNKIWVIDSKPGWLKITFYGKFADSMNLILMVLAGLGASALGGAVSLLFTAPEYWIAILMLLFFTGVLGWLLRVQLQSREEVQELTITRDLVTIRKIIGKKVEMQEIKLNSITRLEMQNPQKRDIVMLIIMPLIYLFVGMFRKEQAPAFFVDGTSYRFFEFGSDVEKKTIIKYLIDYQKNYLR